MGVASYRARSAQILSFAPKQIIEVSPKLDNTPVFERARGLVPPAVRRFIAKEAYTGPRLIIDLGLVESAYGRLKEGLRDAEIYYAVKANPHPAVLTTLRNLGAKFDVASRGEIERCLALGISARRLSFGNTIKRAEDIAFAYEKGVRLFAFDAEEELEKLARHAPGAQVICRLLVTSSSAEWPLSRKFGCEEAMAEALLLKAKTLGLKPAGLSFHVGSQMRDPAEWRPVLARTAALWARLGEQGVKLSILNIGGGFPARYRKDAPPMTYFAKRVRSMVAEFFPTPPKRIIAEPGRGLVGEAGVIEAEVLLVSRKSEDDPRRWVFLDIGKFGGLAETMEEMIRYTIVTDRDSDPLGPCVLAGPTCDSVDVLYEENPVMLPTTLRAGDRVLLPSTGAYTSTYSSVWFNGFTPLAEVALDKRGRRARPRR